eukprot:jgi/Psemu1/293301/fgenesh1_pg.2054_\
MIPASSKYSSHDEQYSHYHRLNQHQNSEGGLPPTNHENRGTSPSRNSDIQQQRRPHRDRSTEHTRNYGQDSDHANLYPQHHVSYHHNRQHAHQTRSQDFDRFFNYPDQPLNVAPYDPHFSPRWQLLLGTPSNPLSIYDKNLSRNRSNIDVADSAGKNNNESAHLAHASPEHSNLSSGRESRKNQSSISKTQVAAKETSIPIRGMVLQDPQLSPPCSSLRTNRIYLRIKRPSTEQINDEDQMDSARCSSSNGPDSPKKKIHESRIAPFRSTRASIECGHHTTRADSGSLRIRHDTDAIAGDWYENNLELSRVTSFVKSQAISHFDKAHQVLFPSDKMIMTRKLLSMECGPLWWDWRWKPPDSFVLYFADVLTAKVKEYLRSSRGNVYWVKHVPFWKNLLDPKNDWWNTEQGAIYNDFANRLFLNLLNRWGSSSSDLIECHDPGDQSIFLRACVLFASGSERSINNEANNDALSKYRNLRNGLLRHHVDEYVKNYTSIAF